MTVCLVIPPSPFLLDERVFMSLGVLKVAAALEQNKTPVEMLDLSGVANFAEATAAHVRASSARIFGITATSPQLPAAVEIASLIKRMLPDVKIILGGPHVTLVNAGKKRDEFLRREGRAAVAFDRLKPYFDVLVAGDGERAIFKAIEAPPRSLIDADDRHSDLFLDDAALDRSPPPARHLIDVESYRYQIDGHPALSLIAQLGCPFGCGFCAGRHSPMLRHIRARSAETVVAEMLDMWTQYGVSGFMFYDDELNVNRGLVDLMNKIAFAQESNGIEWRLRGFIKAELFTDEQAAAMVAAGFRWILVGFESGSDRILANINKKATRSDNRRCIEIARRHGLKVKALMSIGHPGESLVTIEETLSWLLSVRPNDFDVTIITPYPGSPYYDEAVPNKYSRGNSWIYRCKNGDALYQRDVDYTQTADYYKGDPNDGYVAHVWTDTLNPRDLVRYRNMLEDRLRGALGIPFNPSVPAMLYEHSMGQTRLPPRILRTSEALH